MSQRLVKVAKELNLGTDSIVEYLGKKGIVIEAKPTTMITDEMHYLLLKKFSSNVAVSSLEDLDLIEIEDLAPGNADRSCMDEPLDEAFDRENPFEEYIIDSIQNGINFKGRKTKNLNFGKRTLNSIFSDEEAFSICLGAENNELSRASRRFFRGKRIEEDIYNVHYASMQALEKYGPEYVEYIFSLPPLPFKASNVKEMFSEFDRRKKDTDIPVFRIIIADSKYTLRFFEDGKSKINEQIIEVSKKNDSSVRFYVSRSGKILPKYSFKNIVPIMKIFLRYSHSFKDYIINYGLETGECSACGRKLTDPISIKRGIGPVCGGYRY